MSKATTILGGVSLAVEDGVLRVELPPSKDEKNNSSSELLAVVTKRLADVDSAVIDLTCVIEDEVFANDMVECNCADECDGSCTKGKLVAVLKRLRDLT